MSVQTPLRDRLDQTSSSGDLRSFKQTKTASLSASNSLFANRPVYSSPQPLNAQISLSGYMTPVKAFPNSPNAFFKANNLVISDFGQINNLDLESPKLDSSRALLQRVENALRKSQSLTPAKFGAEKVRDAPKLEAQNQPSRESVTTNLSIGSPTPSSYNDFFKIKPSTTIARDSRDVWKEKHDERFNDLKLQGESLKQMHEDLLRDSHLSRNHSMNILQSSMQDCINKSPTVTQGENKLQYRDQGFGEINSLRSRLNNIEGQLNALESFSSSSIMNRASSPNILPSALPSAPRSQSCMSRKSSTFEKEEPGNYASLAILKEHTPAFFGSNSNSKASSVPMSVVDVSNIKNDMSFISNKINNLDLSVNNMEFIIQKNLFQSPTPTRSRLNSHQSQSSNASRTTKSSNMPIRVTYQTSGFERNARETSLLKSPENFQERVKTQISFDRNAAESSGMVNAAHQTSSSSMSKNASEVKLNKLKLAEFIPKDLTDSERNHVVVTDDSRINKVHPERPLQAFPNSILKKSTRPTEKEQSLRKHKISYNDEVDDLEEPVKNQKKERQLVINAEKNSMLSGEANLDASPVSGDKKMKKLILRSKSIEDIDKKDATALRKNSSQSKNQNEDPVPLKKNTSLAKNLNEETGKAGDLSEDKKRTQDSRPSSQVTFRELGVNNFKIQRYSKEGLNDGRKLSNSIFEDADQPSDFGSEAPRMSPPTKSREKVAAKLPQSTHIRSYSGGHYVSRPRNLIFPIEHSEMHAPNARNNLVNKPRLSENPKKKPLVVNFF